VNFLKHAREKVVLGALSSRLIIWDGHPYLMVETACAPESRIQRIWTVCCSDDYNWLAVCLFP